MNFPRPNRAPVTRNEEARALIDKAWDACYGCRTKWRLIDGTLNHCVGEMTFRCWAANERQKLQELVKETAK